MRSGLRRNIAAFVPTRIANCAMWLDAGQITGIADGAALPTWQDKSGNARDATQATVSKQPLYRATNAVVPLPNARPVVQFDGVGSVLATSTPANSSNTFTVFVVCQRTATSTLDEPVFTNRNPASSTPIAAQIGFASTNVLRQDYRNDANVIVQSQSALTYPIAVYHQFEATSDGTTASSLVDGSQVSSGAVPAGAVTTTNTYLANDSATFYAPLLIAEVISYSRGLTTTERQQVEAYLKTKYGTP